MSLPFNPWRDKQQYHCILLLTIFPLPRRILPDWETYIEIMIYSSIIIMIYSSKMVLKFLNLTFILSSFSQLPKKIKPYILKCKIKYKLIAIRKGSLRVAVPSPTQGETVAKEFPSLCFTLEGGEGTATRRLGEKQRISRLKS